MRIYSWNVNGIRALQKKGFVDWVLKESPDILCLQETKAMPGQLDGDIASISGYKSVWNAAGRRGYSGVAVYYKTDPVAVMSEIGEERFDSEGRILVLQYRDFTLLNIYFPNSGRGDERLQYKLEFYQHIMSYCDGLIQLDQNLIICGDFNTAHQEIDLKNPQANRTSPGFLKVEREMLDTFLARGYVDVFRHLYPDRQEYTWWDYRTKARERNVGWRIDYFYVTPGILDRVDDCRHLSQVGGSDHCPVALILKQDMQNI